MKKKLIISLVALATCCVAVGCKEGKVTAPDPVADTYQSNYTGRYHAPTTTGVTIDGKLDEAFWQDKAYMEQSYLDNVNGNRARLKITATPSDEGVYVASVIYDSNIVTYDELHSIALSKTTSWEIHFLNLAKGEDPRNLSTTETTLRRKLFYADSQGNFMLGTPDAYGEGATYVEGVADSGDTKYVSLEAFIPYNVLGIDVSEGTPEAFYLLPTFRSVTAGSSMGSTMQLSPYPWIYATGYYAFGENGYTQPTAENAVLGNAKSGYPKTAGWDVSKEAEGEVTMRGNTWQHIFFKDVYGKDLVVTADVEIPTADYTSRFYTDKASKVGFVFYDTYGNNKTVLVDGLNYTTRQYEKYKILFADKGGGGTVNFGEVVPAAPTNKFTLKVTKLGATYTVYVNGEYVGQTDISNLAYEVFPGLYALNMEAKFTNYSCEVYDPTANGEVQYKQKFYLEKEDLSGYDLENPVTLTSYGKANEAANLPKTYFIDGRSYELDETASDNVDGLTVKTDGTTELTGYYKRVFSFAGTRANYHYFASCTSVELSAKATVGKDGQRFNGFVIGQGDVASTANKIAFVFTENQVRIQRNYGWDNDGYRTSNLSASTVLSSKDASSSILKADSETLVKLVIADGTASVYADGELYLQVSLAGLFADLGMNGEGGMDATQALQVGLYGYDCNVEGQNVTFREASVIVG